MNLRGGAAVINNCKKVKLAGDGEGYDYFQKLPDELVIAIFTKLSNGQGHNTLEDVKSLGQCSTVSKRFNSLTSLVPTLFISHRAITVLYVSCPKILNKFKHIRSLRLEYRTNTKGVQSDLTHIPTICTKAIYDPPHNYTLAVISYTSDDFDPNEQDHYPTRTLTNATKDDNDVINATRIYASALFHLHHMLLSSIRDHKLLQEVVVTDWYHYESFTLGEDQLVQLRNINGNSVQVQGCHRSGFCDVVSVGLSDCLVVFNNMTFSIFQKWQEDSTRRRDDDIPQFETEVGTVFDIALEKMLKMEADHDVDYELVPSIVREENWF